MTRLSRGKQICTDMTVLKRVTGPLTFNKVVKRKANPYRYDCTERCDWAINILHSTISSTFVVQEAKETNTSILFMIKISYTLKDI